mgnify:FL=1
MDIVVGNIFNDIINFKNNKINISIMCQRIFYYIQEYLKPTKYSEEDILTISCNVADIIEYNLNKLENENKLIYMNIKDILKLINDLIYQSKIV